MSTHETLRDIVIAEGGPFPVRADLRTRAPGERRPLVIVLHGFLGYKGWGFFPYLSERIAEAGFHVLTATFSMSGVDEATGRFAEPERFARNTVSAELEDARRVARAVRGGALEPEAPCDGSWALLGHSRGGAVALLAAGELPETRSLVTWSTVARLDRYTAARKAAWRRDGALVFSDARAAAPLRLDYAYYEDIDRHREAFDLPRAAGRLAAPHLMVHGERDGAVTLREVETLLAVPRPAEARLEIVRGAGHTFNARHPMRRPTPALERAIATTLDWLRRTAGDERTDGSCARASSRSR